MNLTIKAPGRIVLFGEHQDYLELPVIPAAVDLFMKIKGKKTNSDQYYINLPDIQDSQSFLATNTKYQHARDYLRSGVKVLQENEIIPSDKGISAVITSDIPMQVGLSSSSALCVIWIAFLAEVFNNPLNPMEITKFAHQSEVLEFNEPGGMQDHMAIAHGYINFEEFDPIRCTRLLTELPGLVVGNSLERKDTLNTLATIKNGVRKGLEFMETLKVRDLTIDEVQELEPIKGQLDEFTLNALKAAVTNFEITKQAHIELQKSAWDENYIGSLMNKHHASLRDYLGVSTPKIEKIIDVAMKAGALGCKITGSGNGGCMIALCPDHEDDVSKAIQRVGGQTHIAKVVSGVSRF
ncbi:MAG: GHMP kinase [Candidatus Heimdallarchaeota archaeon]|nr:MAG: GHMP kinase [Candidatus Heimdallarchaeota archaeon]